MGRGAQHGSDAGSPRPKKSLFKRLFSKGIRQRSAGRILVDGEGSPSQSSAATVSAPTTPHGAPADCAMPPSSPTAAAAAASSGIVPADGVTVATASFGAAASSNGPRNLIVQVIAARRLRAADSNGLSDPYCLVKVGSNHISTKTELKTLEPRWNETMAFGPADVEEAEAEGRPYVALRVFDWDLVSADDFLGQAELPFAEVDASHTGPSEPRWLPLYGWKGTGKTAKKVDAGDICVQAYFEAGGREQSGGSALSTLCCQPGTRKQVPLVVHSSNGSLYEEPLMVCLAVTLERIEGMHVPLAAQAAGASKAAEAGAFSPAFSRISAITRNSLSPGAPAGKKPALGGLLGRVLPGRPGGNGRRLDRSVSIHSATSDEMLAGEDPGDEYGGSLHFGYQEDAEPVFEGESLDLDASRSLSRMSPAPSSLGLPPPLPNPLLAARAAAAAAAASPFRLASVGEDAPMSDAADDSSLSGMRCYARLVLGRQKHTSYIKKERLNGTVNLQQTFVFAAPLPLRDRELRIEVYRTASSTQRGRLVSIANIWLHDLLPAGLSHNLEAVRRRTVDLEGVLKNQAGGCARLRCTLVDTDQRRAIYQTPLLEGDLAEDVGEEEGSSELGGGQCSQDDPRAMVQRLQSTTEGLSPAELRQKALLSEKSFSAWQGSRPKQLQDMASALLPAASDLAQQSWRRVLRLLSASEAENINESIDAASDAAASTATATLPELPAPAGRLELTVDTVTLAGAAASGDVFIVLKCGPHWGRSKVLPLAGHTAACGWHLSFPVLDPAAVLTLAVFQQLRGGKTNGRPGFLSASAVQVAGKLRVRLSCLWPNTQHSASLPLLGDRAKGAQVVGAVSLSLHACYASTKALFKGYAAPALPKAAYVHGVDDKGHQGALARETRRIVLRWLESTNPPISGPVALTVLDLEREAFAMSRARLNMRRIQMALVGVCRFKRHFDDIKTWKEPKHSVAAMAGICFFCFLPRLAIPALLVWLVVSTLMAQPENAGLPAPMQQDPPGIEPENESLEMGTSNPVAALRAKLDRLQRVGLTVQNALDGVACAMERFGALLSWQDPSVTLGMCIALSAVAALIFLLGLSTVLAFALCFVIRPPALRTPTPPLPASVFGRLPTRNDLTA